MILRAEYPPGGDPKLLVNTTIPPSEQGYMSGVKGHMFAAIPAEGGHVTNGASGGIQRQTRG